MIERADDQIAHLLRVAQAALALIESPLHLPIIVAGAPHFVPPFLLEERAGPLRKVPAPLVLGVPRARIDVHFFDGWILLQVLTDMDGREAKGARPEPIQNGPVEEAPEPALD